MLPQTVSGHRFPPRPAVLVLADGTVFRGESIGAEGHCSATIVFHTAMTGHQEVLTDPAYTNQIVAFTYPHIGSVGVNPADAMSAKAAISGLVVRDCPAVMSNFRATQSLPAWLVEHGVVAISGIDTRKLTRLLRDHGSQGACILSGDDIDTALEHARSVKPEADAHPVQAVSTQTAYDWAEGPQSLSGGSEAIPTAHYHVVVYDFGVKRSLLRTLVGHGCRVTVVPAHASAADVLARKPDGIVLSSGPGDATLLTDILPVCRALIDAKVPLLGTGLGQQLLALSLGASVARLRCGRRGINHPVRDNATGRVQITSQNYGLTILPDNLPDNMRVTHRSLFDGAVQGFELTDAPVLGLLGYPEGGPGPADAAPVFRRFTDLMAANR